MENLGAVMKALSFRIRVIGLGLGLMLGLQMIAYGQSAGATNGSAMQLKSSDVIRLMISGRSLSATDVENLDLIIPSAKIRRSNSRRMNTRCGSS